MRNQCERLFDAMPLPVEVDGLAAALPVDIVVDDEEAARRQVRVEQLDGLQSGREGVAVEPQHRQLQRGAFLGDQTGERLVEVAGQEAQARGVQLQPHGAGLDGLEAVSVEQCDVVSLSLLPVQLVASRGAGGGGRRHVLLQVRQPRERVRQVDPPPFSARAEKFESLCRDKRHAAAEDPRLQEVAGHAVLDHLGHQCRRVIQTALACHREGGPDAGGVPAVHVCGRAGRARQDLVAEEGERLVVCRRRGEATDQQHHPSLPVMQGIVVTWVSVP
mmetsp:Transcript_13578/g.33896  ORF Transcript_13578/g.33896 Transcript_13578/m.33896 type:complete len:275 (-) Transcript_13578:139-963(-)